MTMKMMIITFIFGNVFTIIKLATFLTHLILEFRHETFREKRLFLFRFYFVRHSECSIPFYLKLIRVNLITDAFRFQFGS